jgi:hypothetical protein
MTSRFLAIEPFTDIADSPKSLDSKSDDGLR